MFVSALSVVLLETWRESCVFTKTPPGVLGSLLFKLFLTFQTFEIK